MYRYSLPIPMLNSYSKYRGGMIQTDIASRLSATIFLATDSQKGLITFSHIKTIMSEVMIDWKEVKECSPNTYDKFMSAKIDVWDFLEKHGIWGYVFDPSLNEGKGWFWEIKYLNKTFSSVSLSDCVLTTQSSCISRMIWRAFKLLEDGEVEVIDEQKDYTPFDLKKAQKEVDGLMNLYTSTAVKNARKKKKYKTHPSLLKRGRRGAK